MSTLDKLASDTPTGKMLRKRILASFFDTPEESFNRVLNPLGYSVRPFGREALELKVNEPDGSKIFRGTLLPALVKAGIYSPQSWDVAATVNRDTSMFAIFSRKLR